MMHPCFAFESFGLYNGNRHNVDTVSKTIPNNNGYVSPMKHFPWKKI